MTREVVIGLDVGTTAVKAVAFGLGSTWRHMAARECGTGPVQDPARVSAAITDVLAECAAACAGSTVLAVSVSTAMHGLLALDADMRPLTPLVTWADGRAADHAWRLHTAGQAPELHRVSGTPVHPMTPLTKLLWFREEEPELWTRARWWVGLKDYVLRQLTGDLATELSSASGTGLLDMASRDWNPEALKLTHVDAEQLPRILPTTAVLELSPVAARGTGLPAGTPVVAGAADGPLGNLGAGATAPGVAGLSLGTSGAVRMVRPEPYSDPECRLFSYALTDSAWVVGAAASNGAEAVRWASGVFSSRPGPGHERDAELLELAAAVAAGSDGLIKALAPAPHQGIPGRGPHPMSAKASGVGTYTATIATPAGWSTRNGAYLDLGKAVDTIRVGVNGHPVRGIDQSDISRIDLGRRLRPGPNTITVTVATTLHKRGQGHGRRHLPPAEPANRPAGPRRPDPYVESPLC